MRRARLLTAASAAAVVACCGLLAACSGLFETKTMPPSIYLLSADRRNPDTAPGSIAPALAVDLAVLKPRVRAGLETDRIAALYPNRHLEYFANARWSGPLDEVMQDLIVQKFRSRIRLGNVSSDASVFFSAYWLEVEVVDFQAEYADTTASSATTPPTVRVQLQAQLGSSAERRVVARFQADSERAAADNRLSAIVDAYNRAMNAALDELANDCREALGTQKPASPVNSAKR